MEWLSKVIEWLKLPTKIIAFIALMAGILLFLPQSVIQKLHLELFITSYGNYFGIVFLIAACYLLFLLICFIGTTIKSKINNKINLQKSKTTDKLLEEKIKENIQNLSFSERCIIREFSWQQKNVIKVIMENEDVVSLINKKILEYATTFGEKYIFGTVISVKLNAIADKLLEIEDLQIKETPTKSDFEQYMKERPGFIMQIQSIEELKNNIANPFHHFR